MTQTQKNGNSTSRRTVTVTRGSGGPSKIAKSDGDDDNDDSPFKEEDKKGGDDKPSKKDKDKAKSGEKKSDKVAVAETGIAWTNKISKMKKIPDDEVTGKIDGIEFTLDRASITGGRLIFQKNPRFRGVFSELELSLALFLKPNQDVSGQKLVVNGRIRGGDPHVHMSAMRKGDRIPRSDAHLDYLLVLEFGDYDAENRMQPGKIYICLPDRAKSFLAGSFEASVD